MRREKVTEYGLVGERTEENELRWKPWLWTLEERERE